MSVNIKETWGKSSSIKIGLMGVDSWNLKKFKNLYNKKLGDIQVYEIKPWDIQIGDTLQIRSEEVLMQLEEQNLIPCHWNKELHNFFENEMSTITVDEEIYQNVFENNVTIKSVLYNEENDLYYHLSLPMLTYKKKKEKKNTNVHKELDKQKVTKIRQEDKDECIIQEMISKVDKKRLKSLLSISASLGETKRTRYVVSDEIVEEYLRIWAEVKYEYYLLFNKNLVIDKDIKVEVSEKEMEFLKEDLCKRFPKYAIYIMGLKTSYFITNKIDTNQLPDYFKYGKKFFSGQGMKLSKFFSKFLQDNEFDIELSKILQNKEVTTTIYLSIDPYDYLTSSLNKHKWKSCHRITTGDWGTGSVSYMLDDATIVSYRAKRDTDYSYNYWGFKFKGNSKLYRQIIYFSKDNSSMLFSKQYPSENKHFSEAIRHFLESTVANYLSVDNEWTLYQNAYEGKYIDVSSLHYSDIKNDAEFVFSKLTNGNNTASLWEVGAKNTPCLKGCGGTVKESGESMLCCKCYNPHNVAKEYICDFQN